MISQQVPEVTETFGALSGPRLSTDLEGYRDAGNVIKSNGESVPYGFVESG
jgi:hypothetical protein